MLFRSTQSEDVKELLNALIDYKLVDKIITSFIQAFRNAQPGPDGWHYLFGNLNLGGTVSGRLSASEPNLQTIPSGSKYAKKIKKCFEAPPSCYLPNRGKLDTLIQSLKNTIGGAE